MPRRTPFSLDPISSAPLRPCLKKKKGPGLMRFFFCGGTTSWGQVRWWLLLIGSWRRKGVFFFQRGTPFF